MFPPAQPWKTINAPDPDRTYLAFSSRFAMRSFVTVPSFFMRGLAIQKQIATADGVIGFSLGANLPSLEFYTLSAWEDEAHLYRFARELAHGEGMRQFHSKMRSPSAFVTWQVRGADLPLAWPDALERIRAHATTPHPATNPT
jgi:hypothetical protein